MLTPKKHSKANTNQNGKVLQLMNDRGVIASYLARSLVYLFDPKKTGQFILVKDFTSNKFIVFFINKNITVTY